MSETALRVEDLSAAYGPTPVIEEVSFEVAAGEKVAVVGESGCGKSTLAMAILGLLPAPGHVTTGQVSLAEGGPLDYANAKAMNRIRGARLSLIFQDPMTSLDPVKTIGYQLAEAIRVHEPKFSRQQVKQRSIELLNQVEIPDAESRLADYPHQYSGGMRQRVLIAVAMAHEPDVIIADEPTTALDVTTQAQILDLLDRLVSEHEISVVLITHDLGVVAQFCDRVLVMYAGRIVEQGPADGFFDGPAHPYSRALLASVPTSSALQSRRLWTLPGLPPSLAGKPSGCSFHPRCVAATAACVEREPTMVPVLGDEWSAECLRVGDIDWKALAVDTESIENGAAT